MQESSTYLTSHQNWRGLSIPVTEKEMSNQAPAQLRQIASIQSLVQNW